MLVTLEKIHTFYDPPIERVHRKWCTAFVFNLCTVCKWRHCHHVGVPSSFQMFLMSSFCFWPATCQTWHCLRISRGWFMRSVSIFLGPTLGPTLGYSGRKLAMWANTHKSETEILGLLDCQWSSGNWNFKFTPKQIEVWSLRRKWNVAWQETKVNWQ